MPTFPKYESYKDSGVEWLGEIPSSWRILPLTKYAKSLVDYRGKTPTKVESGVFLVTAKNIKEGLIDYEISKEYVSENEYDQIMSRGKPQIGDLLFTTEAPLGGIALVNREDIALAQRIIKFRINEEYLLPKFARYSMISTYFQDYLVTEATGSTAQGIKASKLHKLKIITPPLLEQKRIVEFLDRTTTEIDRAISHKQRLIELLQEQKAILINQAVTKGLNPNVPVRDSGIEWLKKIPEHWEVRRAKYLFKEIDERSQTGEEELLSVSHMTGVTPRSEKNVYMFMAEDYTGSKLCRKDDLVINIMWAWMGALGVSDRTGIVSPSYGVFRQIKRGTFNSWYLEHLLRSTEYVAQYNRVSTGLHSSRLRLYSHMFLGMEITVPSKEEQDQIEAITTQRTGDIDKAINAVEREIATLEELRSVLISQAVTGKIKV